MWRKRDRRSGLVGPASGVYGALALLAILVPGSACAPDGPPTDLPTHPSDTYSVSLEWDAPTRDAMGRPLDDLSGYRLYYRPVEAADFGPAVDVGTAARTTVDGLPAGDYLFAVSAVDLEGNESDLSEPLAVEVGP